MTLADEDKKHDEEKLKEEEEPDIIIVVPNPDDGNNNNNNTSNNSDNSNNNNECCNNSSTTCCSISITTLVGVTLITAAAMALSIASVTTCEFVRVRNNGPWIGLLGYGIPTTIHNDDDVYHNYGNSNTQIQGECSVDYWDVYSSYDYNDYYYAPDLEDGAGLTARIFGVVAALMGVMIFVSTIVMSTCSCSCCAPNYMWRAIAISSFFNTIFQGLTFVIYANEACVDEHYYGYNYFEDFPNYNLDDYWYDYYNYCANHDDDLQHKEDDHSHHFDRNQRKLQVLNTPSLSPTTAISTTGPTPSVQITPAPFVLNTSMPTYCIGLLNEQESTLSKYEYALKSGPGCELAAGACIAITAMAFWFIAGIIMIFRKPMKGQVLIDCEKLCVSGCCYGDNGNVINSQSSTDNYGATKGLQSDFRKVVKEEVGADGTKHIVTSFEPNYKEKTTFEEFCLVDGSKLVKTTKESFEHQQV